MDNTLKISIAISLGLVGIVLAANAFSLGDALPWLPVVVFAGFMPYFLRMYLKYSELKAMEESLPEFLRNLSESQKSGITLSKAIVNSTRIEYGPLSKEIEKMAIQISWGVPLPRVLEKFSNRVEKSDFMRRSIAIILESYRSGGDVAEVMESVAESARMIKDLESERRSKFNQQLLVMYAIFIIFIVIIIALNKILLPMFTLSASQDVGGVALSMGNLDPSFYRTTFLHMILMQAVFAGLIAGQVGEGSIVAGTKHSAIMLAIGSLAFIFFLPPQQVLINVENPYDVYPPGSLYTLEGFVLKNDKSPLSEARVEIDAAGTLYKTTTDSLGAFSKEVILPEEAGTYKITIKANHPSGKGTHTLEVRVG